MIEHQQGKTMLNISFLGRHIAVVIWITIRLLMICAMFLNSKLREVGSEMAYNQAPIEYSMYMILPTDTE